MSWRRALAERIANAYAQSPNALAVMIAGSVGRGTDDRYSDIEVDVYYERPPTEQERIAMVAACGAELVGLAEDDDEWEETMSFGGFKAASSTFLAATMERYLAEVLDQCQLAPSAQTRLFSLQQAVTVKGEALVERWRARAAAYPPGLTATMLREHLPFEGFWYAEEMLAARDDRLLLYRGFIQVGQQLIGALLGLNRQYMPTPDMLKWLDQTIAGLPLKPADLSLRLKRAFQVEPVEGVRDMKALIAETLALVERELPEFDTAPYRANLGRSRGVWDAPPNHP